MHRRNESDNTVITIIVVIVAMGVVAWFLWWAAAQWWLCPLLLTASGLVLWVSSFYMNGGMAAIVWSQRIVGGAAFLFALIMFMKDWALAGPTPMT